jgi:dynein light intermediate chain 1
MLIHSSLDIESSRGRRETPKASVIERDKILVPPNWDSAGKIRVLRDGSDTELEEVSQRWSEDIRNGLVGSPISPLPPLSPSEEGFDKEQTGDQHLPSKAENSAMTMYEDKVPYSGVGSYSHDQGRRGSELEVPNVDMQEFLRGQLKVLDGLRQKADSAKANAKVDTETTSASGGGTAVRGQDMGVSHHIGPVKCNIGGIQVDIDADEAVRRLLVGFFFTYSLSSIVLMFFND